MGFDVTTQDFDPIGWSSSPSNPPPRLDRFVVDIETRTITSRDRLPLTDPLTGADIPVDMPTFHPLRDGERCRYAYFAGACRPEGWFPFRSIVRADLEEGTAVVRCRPVPLRSLRY